ncbi:MAG: DUF6377 domain-containing protein [Candidatus Azobacteroides sp.]|nr:DUF6377 domain-containing protein [Candidatus Azobacteroides sp.]
MKKIVVFFFCLSVPLYALSSKNEIDSLLKVLDKTLAERTSFVEKKNSRIHLLKLRLNERKTLEEKYHINAEIVNEYQPYVCDSAILYVNENIKIAERLNNPEYLYDSKIRLAFIYSISGLFTQAQEILRAIQLKDLPQSLQLAYCWCYLRYYENLIRYTDDRKFSQEYSLIYELYRDTIMEILPTDTEFYEKERAFMLQQKGYYEEALAILTRTFLAEEPSTHSYAMASMSLAKLYELMGEKDLAKKYLLLAAITDTQLAVKENESLLALATHVYEEGDVNRAYHYIKVSLEDANYYNSRFRNTVIARVQPIIEESYLVKIQQQSKNLRLYAILTSALILILAGSVYFVYKQMKVVSKARKNLRKMYRKLEVVNRKLDEANSVKEKYIGFFMNYCVLYIDKQDEYRKTINRKIKVGQIDDLYKMTSSKRNLEKDMEDFYSVFDEAFLNLYPNFVEEFNLLLKEEERYVIKNGKMNTEIRIFALMKLGITDTNQISSFLRYSLQTIYNYKSKVKGKAINPNNFEEEIKKISSFS